ncbi:MAG: futalosine hydrolase, partial [Planctomycetota bacterium]
GLLTPAAMGLPQWSAPGAEPVFDALPLAGEGPELLTVCAAAGGADDVAGRIARAPEAAAEDMEGFAVALAASNAGVELRIVRGISNEAGDRDHARWRIEDALFAVARLTVDALA